MHIGKARKMSFVSQNSSTSSTSMTVSSKPWFLTYNVDDSDVFVWRDGVRMKLRNGDSAGTVVSVSVSDGILTVSTESVSMSTIYYYCC